MGAVRRASPISDWRRWLAPERRKPAAGRRATWLAGQAASERSDIYALGPGGKDAMKPWLAVACLAALAAGLVMETWGLERQSLNTALPSDMGPEALAQQARNILAGLSYPKPAAQDWNFDIDFPRIMALARRDRKSLRARVAEARPPLIYFWYRSAPQRLAPWYSHTKVSEVDPPQVAAGSVTMRLDLTVALRVWPATRKRST